MTLVLVLLAGCVIDDGPIHRDHGSPPDVDVGDETVDLGGRSFVWPTGEGGTGEVCWSADHEVVCVESSQPVGSFLVEDLEAYSTGELLLRPTNAVATRLPLVLGRGDLLVGVALDSPEALATRHAQAGVDLVAGQATVRVAVGGVSQGARVSIGDDRGEGPFYLADDALSLEPRATATTTAGVAWFFAVDPAAGPLEVQAIGPDGEPCDLAGYGEWVPEPLTVAPDEVLELFLRCT